MHIKLNFFSEFLNIKTRIQSVATFITVKKWDQMLHINNVLLSMSNKLCFLNIFRMRVKSEYGNYNELNYVSQKAKCG